MTPSEATDWIVAEPAACPSMAREVLSACMAPVIASLECKYCVLKAAVYFVVDFVE